MTLVVVLAPVPLFNGSQMLPTQISPHLCIFKRQLAREIREILPRVFWPLVDIILTNSLNGLRGHMFFKNS